ncbi:hypothetical protein D6D23_08233 [Aureobasidium pullulans]|nr:hypothetical protein D6D23_08233 [Aureobasidium pullulans]THX98689.1 hypothetical protein D6D03_07781 [Aureobasidium pullulans]
MAPSASTTTGLLSMPTELLIRIFEDSPDIPTSVRLSSVHKLLHDIWLDNNDYIVRSIAKSTIPQAKEAMDLAVLETRCRRHISHEIPPPSHLWLPNLVRILDLSATAHAGCVSYRAMWSPRDDLPDLACYYPIRLCVLAFEYPEARGALHARLQTSSANQLRDYYKLYTAIQNPLSDEEATRQGLRASIFEPSRFQHYRSVEFTEDRWAYTRQVIVSAMRDRRNGTNELPELPAAIDGYAIDSWYF